jgi:hypothetical protein
LTRYRSTARVSVSALELYIAAVESFIHRSFKAARAVMNAGSTEKYAPKMVLRRHVEGAYAAKHALSVHT